MEGVGAVLLQPMIGIEVIVLLAPQHAGDGLAHHVGCVPGNRGRGDGLVELIGFTKPVNKDFIKILSKGIARYPSLPPLTKGG